MKNSTSFLALCFSGLMVVGCGGGGSDSNSDSDSVEPTDKTFSISLEQVDLRRVSNGETVNIDTTGVNSGQKRLRME